MIRRICIQWPRFGPYHLARLEAAHRLLAEQGVELVGMETAGLDALYAWRPERGPTPFRRETVFPGRTFEEIPPPEMHAGVGAALDRIDADVVAISSYGYPDARAALEWCRKRRRAAVLLSETKADDAPRSGWREWVKSVLVRQFDAALVGGTPHRQYAERLGLPPERIFMGCDAVDNRYFREGAARARRAPEATRTLPGLERDGPFFLASNRFLPRKNLDGLLRAYAAYRRSAGLPWRLVLLGDGPDRPRLEALVRAERIEGVTFAGFRQIEELPAYYGRAGCFVHPALTEPWGLVVNEAMAAGLPVLVSRPVGCAQDLVLDGENGFRFDPHDVPALARLLARVAGDPAGRDAMARRSLEIIAEWDVDRFAEGLRQAARAGLEAVNTRRPDPAGRLLLWALRRTARSTTSFHSAAVEV